MSIHDRDYAREKEFDYNNGGYKVPDNSKKKKPTFKIAPDGSATVNSIDTKNSRVKKPVHTFFIDHNRIDKFTFVDLLKFITPLVFFFILIVYALIKLFER